MIPASDEAKDILNGYKALQEELRTDGCKLADVLSVAIGLVKDDVRLMRDADIKLREQIAAMDNELYDLVSFTGHWLPVQCISALHSRLDWLIDWFIEWQYIVSIDWLID